MPWTEKQEQVIKERDKTILVSAAAGSGKTATLVERIYQKMIDPEHPVDITSFLVVTFTKAAAAQMKEKFLFLFVVAHVFFFEKAGGSTGTVSGIGAHCKAEHVDPECGYHDNR